MSQQCITSTRWGNQVPCSCSVSHRSLAMVSQPQFSVGGSSHSQVLNVRADRESRTLLDHNDWHLSPVVFYRINQTWGPLELDLFASRLSAQLSRFVSWRPDPGAEAFDAFSLEWSKVRGYAFPHLRLSGVVSDKS